MLRQWGDAYELTPIQAGMLFHAITRPNSGIDIEQVVVRLDGTISHEYLTDAWRRVVQSQPVLRTYFRWQDVPEPLQTIADTVELAVERQDWSGVGLDVQEMRLGRFLTDDRRRGFDLATPPLLRITLIAAGARTVMVWTFHHILLDGRSFAPLLAEVFGAECAQTAPPPFRQYVEWLRTREPSASKSYWQSLLDGYRVPPRLWVESPRSGAVEHGSEFSHVVSRLSPTITRRVTAAATSAGITVNTLLQGAWAVLLAKLSGERDVVFGATRACRRSGPSGAEDIVGILINTLPIRARLDFDAELLGWLQGLRAQNLALRAHEHTPLASVQAWSEVERGRPLFETVVVYEHLTLDDQLKARGSEWNGRSVEYIGQTNFPLALIAYGGERLLLRVEYESSRFADEAAVRMLGYLETAIEDIATRLLDPHQPALLGDVQILPAAERQALLDRAPVTSEPFPTTALHQLFEREVLKSGPSIAVCCDGVSLTYSSLNARANRVAHALRRRGIVRGDMVGLAVDRSSDVVVGILAILKSGAAYVPLDPEYPRERVAFMVEDSQVRAVLASSRHAGSVSTGSVEWIDLATAGAGESESNLEVGSQAGDLAYVIYTSGSTGTPKGVLVTHANVSRLFGSTEAWFRFGPGDVWTLFHSYAFDFSVWELWGALLYGGRLVVVPYWVTRDPTAFRTLLLNEQVTILNQTPSAFRQLVQADLSAEAGRYALREIIFGGEALELQALKPWVDRYGDSRPRLVNMYGITETTVHVTYRPIASGDIAASRGSVIGVPLPDLNLRLLDEHGEPVPVGVPGEIWVGGAGVAVGYLNRPELSRSRFVPDRFSASAEARLYRAGDLARWLPDGELEYLGRIDGQVKIRGFRIELGEIEAALRGCPHVSDVAVIAREDSAGDKRLVAYVVASKDGRAVRGEVLRAQLEETLPRHMIPAQFVNLEALPLNANGKLDRAKLPVPELASGREDREVEYIAPRTETERKIAAAWASVLRVQRVGADDNFFMLGGDSILSIQAIARCRREGLAGITTRDVFEQPVVSALAKVLDAREAGSATVASSSAIATGAVDLMPIQKWFFSHELQHQDHWNQAFLFEMPADIDDRGLEQALDAVCGHHDAFRLRFARLDSGWHAELANAAQPVSLTRHDLSTLPYDARGAEIESRSHAEQTGLDISSGRLLRAALFRLGDRHPTRLLLVVHHLAIDGVSWRILIEDIEAAYTSLAAGKPVVLSPPTTSVQSWAKRLRTYAGEPERASAAKAWLEMLQAPTAQIPVRGEASLERDATSITIELSAEDTSALLQHVPSLYSTQINDALLTALALALEDAIGGHAFLIETEGHGREDIDSQLDLSRTIGWFTALYPVRLALRAGLSIGEALKSIKEQLRSIPDRGLSFSVLRYLSEDPSVQRAFAASPPRRLLFNYLGQFDQVTHGSRLFAFAREKTGPWHAPEGQRTHAIEVLAAVRDGRFQAVWTYCETQMDRALVERLTTGFAQALRSIIAHCKSRDAGGRTPSDFPLAKLDQPAVDQLWALYPGLVDAYPLTPMQRLFHVMEQAGTAVGLEQWQFRIEGKLASSRLRQAFEQVIARHTILRSAFATLSHEPVQVVMPAVTLPWREIDWRHLDAAGRAKALQAEVDRDTQVPLDITRPPLMRVTLARQSEDAWLLLWTTHHLCIDGWSWPRFFQEITQIYAALESGGPPELPRAATYSSYVSWLKRHMETSSAAFWKETLKDFASPTPLALVAKPAVASADGMPQKELASHVTSDVTRALRALSQSSRVTLSTTVQAAWALLLAHYAATNDVVFGAAFSGRPEQLDGIESMIGPCVTNVPVRIRIDLNETLETCLRRLQAQQLNINQNQFIPLDAIQSASEIPWQQRIFDSLVVFQNYTVDTAMGRLGEAARLVPMHTPEATNYALTIAVSPGEQLNMRMIFSGKRFDRASAEAVAGDLPAVLTSFATLGPQAAIVDVLARMPAERRGKAAAVSAEAQAARARGLTATLPTSAAERQLSGIWGSLLGRSDIGIDENFFDAGGQSLLLVRMHRLVESTFDVRIPVVKLLQYPTIRLLAANLVTIHQDPIQRKSELDTDRARKQRAALTKQRARAKLN